MEGGPLLSEEFQEFAKDYVLFLHVTTRIEGRENDDMLRTVGGQGFPTFAVLDEDGEVLAMDAGFMQVDRLRKLAEPAAKLRDLEEKAAAGDAAATAELLLTRAHMGKLKYDEFVRELEGVQLDEDQTARAAHVRMDLQFKKIQETDVGEALLPLVEEGYEPHDDQADDFWIPILRYAGYHEDPALFEKALDALRDVFGDNPNAQGFFAQQEQALRKMKANAGR